MMVTRFSLLALTALALASGCGEREVLPAIDTSAFELDASAQGFDEFGEADCSPEGFGTEADIFEVETDTCDYGTFVQPLQVDIRAGDSIHLLGWHLRLEGEDGAIGSGYMGLSISDERLMEYETQIPADEFVIDRTFKSPRDYPQGSLVRLHIHNHGANSWRLLSVDAGPEESAP